MILAVALLLSSTVPGVTLGEADRNVVPRLDQGPLLLRPNPHESEEVRRQRLELLKQWLERQKQLAPIPPNNPR